MSQDTSGQPPRSRRWCVPPAATREAHVHLPGIDVLLELGPYPGCLLWLLLRDVELWAETAPAARPSLLHDLDPFRGAQAALPGEIAAEVNSLLAMLGREAPGAGADACRNIAAWAAPAAPRTALLFAQAAALLDPRSAEWAREVAARALRCDQPVRAEGWLRRAVALAQRQRDWATYASAFADLAEIHEGRAELSAADDAFQRVLRACRRHSLTGSVRARALLGFHRAALREGRHEAASRLRRAVLRQVHPAGREAPTVYLALAGALAGAGRHAEVLALLRNFEAAGATAEERFALARHLVRAAVSGGDAAARGRAWEQAITLLQHAGGTGELARLLARLSADLHEVAPPAEPPPFRTDSDSSRP